MFKFVFNTFKKDQNYTNFRSILVRYANLFAHKYHKEDKEQFETIINEKNKYWQQTVDTLKSIM